MHAGNTDLSSMADVTSACFILCIVLFTSCQSSAGLDDSCDDVCIADVREGVVHYFRCPDIPIYDMRWWYEGDKSGRPLYKQTKNGSITNVTDITRPDMTVTDEFYLSLFIRLDDDGTRYTCDTIDNVDYHTYREFRLKVYVQPEITISGIDDDDIFAKGETVTVTCVLERMLPLMENPKKFWLRVGSNSYKYPATPTSNRDGTFRYEIKHTLALNTWDKSVTCKVDPSNGFTRMEKHSFVVQGGSAVRAAVGVTLSGVILHYIIMDL